MRGTFTGRAAEEDGENRAAATVKETVGDSGSSRKMATVGR